MIRQRIKDLLGRTRKADGAGPAFGPDQDRAFARLAQHAETAFRLVGASAVGTWEVMLADMGRALGPVPGRAALLERLSDALVPIQQPLQEASHRVRKAVEDGTRAGLAARSLDAATAPVVRLFRGLGPATVKGWREAETYLEPVFASLAPSTATRFAAPAERLRASLDAAADRFAQAMADLDRQPDLDRALAGAVGQWQEAVVRAVEEHLYAARTALVEGAPR